MIGTYIGGMIETDCRYWMEHVIVNLSQYTELKESGRECRVNFEIY